MTTLTLLVGELGLINVTSSSLRRLATGQIVGGGAALLAHLHVPLVPQLLSPRLPSLAPPCIAITPINPSQLLKPCTMFLTKHSIKRTTSMVV
jgi:hypothetical protein